MSLFLLALLQTSVIHSAPDPPGWHHYTNVRFAFSACYPADFEPQEESANGDGRVFIGRDGGRISAWGSHDAGGGLAGSIREDEKRLTATGGRITYRAKGRSWAVLSGVDGGRLFYLKSLHRGQGSEGQIMTVQISYPRTRSASYRPIVERIARCFTVAQRARG